jgi:lysophospholipase L1-like esterase
MFGRFSNLFRLPLLVIGIAFFMCVSCGKHKERMSTTEPVARKDMWWHQRFMENAEAARTGGKQHELIFIGDSITELMKTARPSMEANWEKYHPKEFGISGDSTEHVLWRLQNGELDTLQPKVAVLLIGTNNLNDNSDDEIFEGVQSIVNDLKARMPSTKIVVLALLPRGATPDNIYRKRVAGVNQLLGTKIADNQRVFYMDIGSVFLHPDGMMKMELMPDQLHPSVAGYDEMYKAMKPQIDQLLTGG